MMSYQHKVRITDDAKPDENVVVRWHWPRGTFSKRMSAMEIAIFLMPHLPSVIPLLMYQPNAQRHVYEVYRRLITWPQQSLDELCSWIKPVLGVTDTDLIQLDINCKQPQPVGTVFSIPGV